MTEPGLRLTPEAHGLFSRLPPETKRRIKRALREIAAKPFAGKALQEELIGYRSYRTRRYRIIYRFNETDSCLEVIHFGHRSGVYERLKAILQKQKS